MKTYGVLAIATLLLAFRVTGLLVGDAAAGPYVTSVKVTFEPVSMPKGPGPVTLELNFTPKHDCDEITVSLHRIWNMTYPLDSVWVQPVKKGEWYRHTFEVTIPPNDTSGIELMLYCGRVPEQVACYFVTIGDTLEYHRGNPRGWIKLAPSAKSNDPIRDTMTNEQLQTEYEVWMDLRKPEHRKIAERILGQIPDSTESDLRKGFYVMWLTLEKVFEINENCIEVEPMDEKRGLVPRKHDSDSLNEQGSLPRQFQEKSRLIQGFHFGSADSLTLVPRFGGHRQGIVS